MNARSTTFEFTCPGKHVNEIICSLFHPILFNRTHGKVNYGQGNHYSFGTLGFEEIHCDFIDFTYICVSSPALVRDVNRDIRTFVDHLRSAALHKTQSSPPPSYSTSPVSPASGVGAIAAHAAYSSALTDHNHHHPHHHAITTAEDLGFLSSAHTAATGTIVLEFLQRCPRSWAPVGVFGATGDPLIWEVWSLKFNCLRDDVDRDLVERFVASPIDEQLFDKMLSIVHTVQNATYLPEMPAQAEADAVLDMRYEDCTPYNFKISYKIGSGPRRDASNRHNDKASAPHAIKNFLKQKLAL